MKKQRLFKIDNLRLIAICLVVLGHSIILYSSSWDIYETNINVYFLDIIKKWIDLIQMPLFFSLSGYLFAYSCNKYTFKSLVLKKMKRLLLPYLIIALFYMIPIKKLVHYPGYEEKSVLVIVTDCILKGKDNGHLWFLPCLFICFIAAKILFIIFEKLKIKKFHMDLCILIISIFVSIVSGRLALISYLKNPMGYFVYFYSGYLINSYNDRFGKSKWLYWISVLVLIGASIIPIIFDVKLIVLIKLALVFASFVIIPNRQNKLADFLSKNSFGIYLFHSPLIYITFHYGLYWNPVYVVLLNLAFGAIACLITISIRKTPLKIVIGEM